MPVVDERDREQWRGAVRRAFNVADDAPAFLFAAHDPWRKGFTPLLGATRLARERGVDVVLLLAGVVTWRMASAVAEAGLRDAVRFLGPTQHMPAAYAAADVTVLPTYYDPASKVVIESLMMGVPAITTRYNGAADLLAGQGQPRRGIVLDEPDDVAALADAMAMLADPAQRERHRPAAATLVEQLSIQTHVDQLERVLSDVAVRHSRAGGNPAGV